MKCIPDKAEKNEQKHRWKNSHSARGQMGGEDGRGWSLEIEGPEWQRFESHRPHFP